MPTTPDRRDNPLRLMLPDRDQALAERLGPLLWAQDVCCDAASVPLEISGMLRLDDIPPRETPRAVREAAYARFEEVLAAIDELRYQHAQYPALRLGGHIDRPATYAVDGRLMVPAVLGYITPQVDLRLTAAAPPAGATGRRRGPSPTTPAARRG